MCLNIMISKCLVNMSSEAQLHVGENSNFSVAL